MAAADPAGGKGVPFGLDAAAFARILESGGDALVVIDSDWRYAYFNDLAESLHGMRREDLIGRKVVDVFPEVVDTQLWQVYHRAVREQALLTVEEYFAPLGKWFDIRAIPHDGWLYIHFRDVSERKRGEERERERQEWERARLIGIFMQAPAFMAALRGPQHVFEMANPPYFQLVGHRDILGKSVREALPEVVNQGFLELLDRVYQTGEPFVGNEVPVLLQRTPDAPMEQRFLDFTYTPLIDDGGSVYGILAHGIDLTDRVRLQEERQQLLAEAHARAERESLLNQIGQAVRTSIDPEEVQERAVSLLGQALGLDRCYFSVVDPDRPIVRVGRDWHRPDLPTMTGEYSLASLAKLYEELLVPGYSTVAHEDVHAVVHNPESLAQMESFRMRAFVGVALRDSQGKLVAALRAAMSDAARAWTPEEIALIEQTATLVMTAVETARTQQREHNIASQLQNALQPPPPPPVPGLELASFYRPALAEASVGGDFYDVFAVEKGCTALVVADLSGKGLQAASQLAMVRNMLRFAVYQGQTIAQAVADLHVALVEHDLLAGFATLFVSMYDHAQRTITYVNCGQEPGLIRRADSGEVERLEPTGPVLGGFGAGCFEQKTVPLFPGDVLALFTDGLTEVGPSRRHLLEIDGVSNLLGDGCRSRFAGGARPDPTVVVDDLISGVNRFAGGGGLRDDIALLVGVCAGGGGGGAADDGSAVRADAEERR